MALAKEIMVGGFSAGAAKAINGQVQSAVTAAGTVITDATDLTASINVITTCAAGAGVQLPSCEVGDTVSILNLGASACKVYPDISTGQINQLSAGTAMTLATNTAVTLERFTTLRWMAWLSA